MFKNILISLLLLIMGTTFTSFYKNKSKEHKRKKREELSVSASKSIKKEEIEIIVSFD